MERAKGEAEATQGLRLLVMQGAEAGRTVGRHRQGGITTLVGKSCRQKAPITAPTPGGTSHQGNKLNAMAHIMVGAPEEVKLVRSASDPELETLGL